MIDPLDTHGDALRQALHAETGTFVCSPYALDRIRVRVHRRRWLHHGSVTAVSLPIAEALLLLLTLRGS